MDASVIYLSKYFNMDGIICFDTVEQLNVILEGLCEEDYESRKEAVQDNLNIAFDKYKVVEDFLYNNFFKQFE